MHSVQYQAKTTGQTRMALVACMKVIETWDQNPGVGLIQFDFSYPGAETQSSTGEAQLSLISPLWCKSPNNF